MGSSTPSSVAPAVGSNPRVSACAAVARALLWISTALIAWTQALYALFLAVLARGSRARARTPRRASRAPGGLADRRRPPRGRGDRGEGRQRARARLAARPARGDRRGRRRRRRHGRARARGGRGRRARAPARRQDPRAGRGGARGAGRAAGVLGRERHVGAGRAARAGGRVRRPAGGLRVRAGDVPRPGRHQPGGPVLALRDVDPRQRVGAGLGDRGQRRDLRGAAGGVRRGRPRDGARPDAPVHDGQARVAGGRGAGGAGDGEDGPVDRGRVGAQAADDVPRVADRPARRAARPARLPAAVRADGRLAPAAPLRDAAAARGRAGGHGRARRARPGARARRRPGGAAGRGGGGRPRAPRPLLLARYYVLTTASLAAGLYDYLRHGTPAGWDAPEGTR